MTVNQEAQQRGRDSSYVAPETGPIADGIPVLISLDGLQRSFVPIRYFRDKYGLPEEFGVSLFESKDFNGLGSIEVAGQELQVVRAKVLSAIPPTMPPHGWGASLFTLQLVFRAVLCSINAGVGLKPPEIEYAAASFGEICKLYVDAQLAARMTRTTAPVFQTIYTNWLDRSVQVSRDIYLYPYHRLTWRIQLVTNAYGRIGIIVKTATNTEFVYDAARTCPAADFMVSLLSEVTTRLEQVLAGASFDLQRHAEGDRSAS